MRREDRLVFIKLLCTVCKYFVVSVKGRHYNKVNLQILIGFLKMGFYLCQESDNTSFHKIDCSDELRSQLDMTEKGPKKQKQIKECTGCFKVTFPVKVKSHPFAVRCT